PRGLSCLSLSSDAPSDVQPLASTMRERRPPNTQDQPARATASRLFMRIAPPALGCIAVLLWPASLCQPPDWELVLWRWLRLMDALRLRVTDNDFERREIVVRCGKGEKDRLPDAIALQLQEHLEKVK